MSWTQTGVSCCSLSNEVKASQQLRSSEWPCRHQIPRIPKQLLVPGRWTPLIWAAHLGSVVIGRRSERLCICLLLAFVGMPNKESAIQACSCVRVRIPITSAQRCSCRKLCPYSKIRRTSALDLGTCVFLRPSTADSISCHLGGKQIA